MRFKIGEQVSFLQEEGSGTVVEVLGQDMYLIKDDTGFNRPFPSSQLVKIYGDQSNQMDKGAFEFLSDEELNATRKTSSDKKVTRKADFWEIDLHTHELLESEAGMSSAELLRYQLSCLRSFFRDARAKRMKKLVIIHGVGQGVLKHEVRDFLSKQEGVEFYDADFREYGKGATEVKLYING